MCNEDPVTVMIQAMKSDQVREAEKMLTDAVNNYRRFNADPKSRELSRRDVLVAQHELGLAIAEAHLALEDAVDDEIKDIAQGILAGRDKAASERKTNPTQPPDGYSLNGLRNTLPREEKP